MAVLTAADRIRLGSNGAKRVYEGSLLVWERLSYMVGDGTVGRWVQTPDADDLVIDGEVRFKSRIRDDSAESTTSRHIAAKHTTSGTAMEWRFGQSYAAAYNFTGFPTGAGSPQIVVAGLLRTTAGTTPPGVDRYIGVETRGVAPGSTALGLSARWLTSTDGVTWTPLGGWGTAVRADALSFNGVTPLVIGQTILGRVYWAQMEAVNRAQLVFPGVLWNVLTVPDAANLNVSGDLQVVARLQRPLATGLTTQRFISKDTGNASGNRGWAATWTNAGQIGLAMLPSASVLSNAQVGFAAGAMGWVRITRSNATGAVVLEWAPDSPAEPTTGWTTMASTGSTTPGAVPVVTGTVRVGDRATTPSAPPLEPYAGRLARVIVRDGATTVLDIHENNAGTMVTPSTFVASSGQTVTVQDTSVSAALFGSAGQISTPDLPLPAAFTVVARTRYNADTTGFPTHAAQNVPADPRSYSVYRTTNNGRWYCEITTDGIWANRAGRFVAAPVPPINVDVTAAVTIEPNRSGRMWMTPWTYDDTTGQWTMGTATDTGTAMVPFDSTVPHAVGASFVAGARLLWSEMRSGTDPRTGSVVWRFDANERTGTGTTYTDPRGLTWTLTNALAVAPKSPAPIVQPQTDRLVWRFDANEYPGSGLSYTDPRGRTWTLSAAGAIAGP